MILHTTTMTLSGSHIPLVPSSVPAEDARSMGTRRMMLLGSAKARKTGTKRCEGVIRSGRYWRSTRRTRAEMATRAAVAATSDGIDDAAIVCRCAGVWDVTS